MIKNMCLLISCLFPLVGLAAENINTDNFTTNCIPEKSDALQKATDNYLNFIDRISKGEIFPQMEAAAEIISPNCKKILNGRLFAQNREEFVRDLLSVYENHGGWKVTPVETIIVPSSNTVVLRILIETENFGTYTAIVILRYDSSYLVTEINEVLNQVKGSLTILKILTE